MIAPALIAALLAPPIDCEAGVGVALERAVNPAAAESRARLATSTDPRSRPGLQARARGGYPTPNVIDRAGLRLTLPPPGTDAAYLRIGQASAGIMRAQLAADAVRVAADTRRAHLAVRRAEAALRDAQALHAIAALQAELRARQAKVGVVPGLRAVQARLEVEAAQDEIAAQQAASAAARAELARLTGADAAEGTCASATPPPTEHPALAVGRAESQLIAARVEARDLGADLWPDFVEASWDDQGASSRGILSVGVDIPLSTADRSGLVQAQARAQRAEMIQGIERQITAAQARLAAAEAHQAALDRPLPTDFAAAATHETVEGLAIREALIRVGARRREAAFAVEAARIELLAARGSTALAEAGGPDATAPAPSDR